MDNFDYLTEVLNDYCIKYNLPLDMSADDMIYYFYNNIIVFDPIILSYSRIMD